MIRRETDAELVNAIANLPGVYEYICFHDRPLDFTPAVEPCFVLSNGEDAVAVFEPREGGRAYQGHTMFGPTCRGAKALSVAAEMIEWMRPHADTIVGVVSMSNRASLWFHRRLGFQLVSHDVYDAEGPVALLKMELN